MAENDTTTKAIAENILNGIKHRLGAAWQARLNHGERMLVKQCCLDAAELQLRALAVDPHNDEAQGWLLREKAQIKAQLMNVAAAEVIGLLGAFENSIRWAAQQLIKLAFAAI